MASSIVCKQIGCSAVGGGTCLEGFTPAHLCPHATQTAPSALIKTPLHAATTSVRTKPPSKPKLDFVSPTSLPLGEDLSVEQAAALRRAEGAVVVALAGDEKVGKTTLIASLFDRFLDGAWAGFQFAGSETLVGFEKRLHLARRSSGSRQQDTPRTSRTAPVHFLHLRLCRLNSAERQNLLVADLYGERFRDSADNQDTCRNELKHLKYADRVALCIDGDKLIDVRARQRAVSVVKGLLGNLLEVGHLDRSSVVDVLITKWDKVLSHAKTDLHQAFIAEQVEASLQDEFGERLRCLTCFRVAARPDGNSDLDPCYQLDGVLSVWLAPAPSLAMPPLEFDEPADLRESERYLSRRLPQYVAKKEK